MSKPAWEYLTNHLPEIRRAVLPNTGSRIGEPGLALLLYLSGQTNKKGEFFMTVKTMQEETDIATQRQVEKLLAGFIALGWITPTGESVEYMGRGRPTPVYCLTLFPQYAQQFARTLHESGEIPSAETVEESSKANTEKALRKNNETESEPQPEPDPQAGQGAGAWGIEHDQLLTECLACEPTDGDNGRLVPWLKKQYRPIVLRALKERPADDLVRWCLDTRRGIEHAQPEQEPNKSCDRWKCELFNSAGDALDGKRAVWQPGARQWIACPECEPSITSPTSDLADLTYTPAQQLTAKEQRDNIKAMIAEAQRRFRAS
jgi:hypothetical protein